MPSYNVQEAIGILEHINEVVTKCVITHGVFSLDGFAVADVVEEPEVDVVDFKVALLDVALDSVVEYVRGGRGAKEPVAGLALWLVGYTRGDLPRVSFTKANAIISARDHISNCR